MQQVTLKGNLFEKNKCRCPLVMSKDKHDNYVCNEENKKEHSVLK